MVGEPLVGEPDPVDGISVAAPEVSRSSTPSATSASNSELLRVRPGSSASHTARASAAGSAVRETVGRVDVEAVPVADRGVDRVEGF